MSPGQGSLRVIPALNFFEVSKKRSDVWLVSSPMLVQRQRVSERVDSWTIYLTSCMTRHTRIAEEGEKEMFLPFFSYYCPLKSCSIQIQEWVKRSAEGFLLPAGCKKERRSGIRLNSSP